MLKIKGVKGFTLLETLIAMIILATGIMLLASSWGASTSRLRKTQVNVEISALLERKIAEIESEYRGKSLDTIPEEKEDDFGSDFPDYSWKLESQELPMPDLSSSLAAKEGVTPDMSSMVKQLTEHIAKSVKEVKVTIIYKPKGKSNKKPLIYSATTFFIDYDKVPSGLGGAGGARPNGGGS